MHKKESCLFSACIPQKLRVLWGGGTHSIKNPVQNIMRLWLRWTSHIFVLSVCKSMKNSPTCQSKKWWSSLSCSIVNKICLLVYLQNPKSEISVQALLYYNSIYKRIMMIAVSSYWFVQLKGRERWRCTEFKTPLNSADLVSLMDFRY